MVLCSQALEVMGFLSSSEKDLSRIELLQVAFQV